MSIWAGSTLGLRKLKVGRKMVCASVSCASMLVLVLLVISCACLLPMAMILCAAAVWPYDICSCVWVELTPGLHIVLGHGNFPSSLSSALFGLDEVRRLTREPSMPGQLQ